jgi:periplasmic divalent cation tolerance protein
MADDVSAAVKAAHSYSTPAIIVLPVESVEQGYFGWLLQETRKNETSA